MSNPPNEREAEKTFCVELCSLMISAPGAAIKAGGLPRNYVGNVSYALRAGRFCRAFERRMQLYDTIV